MCRITLSSPDENHPNEDQGACSRDAFVSWQECIKLVGYGVDTLVLNVRYSDESFHPLKRELDEDLSNVLDVLQHEARNTEEAVVSPWSFGGYWLFVEPGGAGKQWRWRLTCRLLTLTVSRGKFNDVIAQVRFSSEYLWREQWAGDALYKVHGLLMSW